MAASGLILLLAACSSAPAVDAPAPRQLEQAEMNPPVGAHQTPAETDQCGAGALQYLVGKNKSEIPVPVQVVNRRVVCTTCPVTMDFAPSRLNIFFNDQTDIVELVRCG